MHDKIALMKIVLLKCGDATSNFKKLKSLLIDISLKNNKEDASNADK
jgi:hypothetical protein